MQRGKLEIMDKIYFETDKDEILPRLFPLLDQIAGTIKGHPESKQYVCRRPQGKTYCCQIRRFNLHTGDTVSGQIPASQGRGALFRLAEG